MAFIFPSFSLLLRAHLPNTLSFIPLLSYLFSRLYWPPSEDYKYTHRHLISGKGVKVLGITTGALGVLRVHLLDNKLNKLHLSNASVQKGAEQMLPINEQQQ